jgi:hydroxymethylpyrimidine/phosphomethylpyrimidine kinase
MERAVRYGIDAGSGPGSVHHLVDLRERAGRVDAAAVANRLAAGLAGRVADDDATLARLAPDGGFRVAATTPYAETPAEAVTPAGQAADAALAAGLLAAREVDPALGLAIRCRHHDRVAAALTALEWPVLDVDLDDLAAIDDDLGRLSGDALAAATDDLAAADDEHAARTDDIADQPASPAAVRARRGPEKSPGLFVVAADAETLTERLDTLAAAVETDASR